MDITTSSKNTFLTSEEEVILSHMEELKKDLEAIKRLRSKYGNVALNGNGHSESSNAPDDVASKKLEEDEREEVSGTKIQDIPSEYSPTLIWDQRVLVVLKMLGSAYADDVKRKILELQPEVSEARADSVATNKLSQLYKKGVIKAETTGKKYKYFI
ncbi:MAG: hypothetical protein EOP48_23040 [Sphingobacteriales bacterium]|nr:MAG: hypothetical protein EOP48_23040 [Sphingobacteriales bacterium]